MLFIMAIITTVVINNTSDISEFIQLLGEDGVFEE